LTPAMRDGREDAGSADAGGAPSGSRAEAGARGASSSTEPAVALGAATLTRRTSGERARRGNGAGAVRIAVGGVTQTVRATSAASLGTERTVLAVLRPDALAFAGASEDAWSGEVTERRFAGALLAYRVRLSAEVEVEVYSTDRDVRVGEPVRVRIAREPVAIVPLED
jgi:ABC-type Fe3+/spermidine/putrescine transport system ATPase subunit